MREIYKRANAAIVAKSKAKTESESESESGRQLQIAHAFPGKRAAA